MPKLITPNTGILVSVAGTNPAAGADWSQTVTANKRWRIQSIRFQLVTDATVATRTVRILFTDGTNTFFLLPAVDVQIASLTYNYECVVDGYQRALHVPGVGAPSAFIPIPNNLWLTGGYVMRTSTINLQAGDDFGAPRFLVEELGYA